VPYTDKKCVAGGSQVRKGPQQVWRGATGQKCETAILKGEVSLENPRADLNACDISARGKEEVTRKTFGRASDR